MPLESAILNPKSAITRMRYYPINLDLAGRSVLVVGGGAIAEGKARQLVEAGAHVLIVSPTLTESLSEMAEQGQI
ncbi:MAG: precorrin-2 dehydrogenase/sirohydrochlorin ferrochelatase family protein, partial [Blastocatellia bacterium]